MTPEERDELLKLLEGVSPSMRTVDESTPGGEPLPDFLTGGSPAPMPMVEGGGPSSAVPMPAIGLEAPARDRDADIEAFLSGGMPESTPTTSPMQPGQRPFAVTTLPGMGAAADRGLDVLATGARPMPAYGGLPERANPEVSQGAVLDSWARDRAERPELPEQAPAPRTYAEARDLHPRYRGQVAGGDPFEKFAASLPGAPKPPGIPASYAEAARMAPELRNDVLERFAKARESNPQHDELWSKFMGTLPGAPKSTELSELDRARVETERARAAELNARAQGRPLDELDRARVETERARAEELRRRGGGGDAEDGGAVADVDGFVETVQRYAEAGQIGASDGYVQRLDHARTLPPKDQARAVQQIMREVDSERTRANAPRVNRDAERESGLQIEEDALRAILPTIEAEAKNDPDRVLPGYGNVASRALVAGQQWLTGKPAIGPTDAAIMSKMELAGSGQYRSETGQVANVAQERETANRLYLSTGRVADVLTNVRKRLADIEAVRARKSGEGASRRARLSGGADDPVKAARDRLNATRPGGGASQPDRAEALLQKYGGGQ